MTLSGLFSKKRLLIVIALTAFVIGVVINFSHHSHDINTDALLQAELTAEVSSNKASSSETDEAEYSAKSLKNLLGKKVTLVNFWASWCAPCREEMPLFEAMYQRAKGDGFNVVGIAIDSPDTAKPMLDSLGVTYPILYAQQTGLEVMSVSGNPQGLLPYTLLLDKDGELIDQRLGLVHEADILAWLTAVGIDVSNSAN